ncbi:MAG TPA: Clp protease N-terminal domain-containing protein, partial [Pirellulales bacterium]
MDLNLKSLIGKLNGTSLRSLESAAGLCMSRTNYNVEIEHWLLKLLEITDTDFSRLLRYYEADASRVTRELTRSIDRLKTGNARPPALSQLVVTLAREAWLLASIDFGAPQVRTGHLLLALVTHDDLARLARDIAPELTKISPENLKKEMLDIVSGSAEDEPAA